MRETFVTHDIKRSMDDSTGCTFSDLRKVCRPGDTAGAVDGMSEKNNILRFRLIWKLQGDFDAVELEGSQWHL